MVPENCDSLRGVSRYRCTKEYRGALLRSKGGYRIQGLVNSIYDPLIQPLLIK